MAYTIEPALAAASVLASLSRILPRAHTSFEVEAMAAASALQLASDLGFQEVVLEGDCQVLMHALIHDSLFLSPNGLRIDAVRSNARYFNQLHYSHVKRESNMVTHDLARFVLNVSDYVVWMKNVPPQLHSFVLADIGGLY